MKFLVKLISFSILISSLFITAAAQSSSGSLRGLITDARKNPVRDVRVILLYANKLAARETKTGENGMFGFDDLRPGDYTLALEADGLTQSGGAAPIRIEAGRVFQIAVALTVAAIEDSLIVSATRTESLLEETAASAFVASGQELLRSQRINAFDALRNSPGVTVMQSGRRGGITSLFVRGGESDYTKVLIDGVPINDAGGAVDFADLTTDNISRLELVRGAQSAIYGSDAMAGVMQLFTHRGSTSVPAFDFTGEGGSFGFNRQFARLSGANRGFDYSASYTHLRTDGRDRNDDYQNRVATANLGYRFNERTQFRLTARKDSSGLGVPGATAILFPDPDERAKRKRITLGANLDDQTTTFWHQRLSFVYSESKYSSFDPASQDLTNPDTPPGTSLASNDFVSAFNSHQRRRGLRYQSDFILPYGHFVSAGIDFEQERAVFDSGFAGLNRVESDRRNLGAFVQDQFQSGPRLFITAGIRIENNRADMPASFAQVLAGIGSTPYNGRVGFGTEVMPKISAIYVLRQSGIQSRRGPTRLKANFGEGLKAPSLVETFSPSPFFLGNPELKPERSRNFDIGIEQFFWKDRVRIEGTYYDNRYRNQIAFVANPATFGGPITLPNGRMTHYVNQEKSRARGMELSTSWHPKRWLQFDGNYTLLHTELLEGADIIDYNTLQLIPNPEVGLHLLRRPKHSGSFNASWIGEKFDLNLIGVFVGRRRDVNPATFLKFDTLGQPISNGGFARVDLAGSYRLNRWMTLFARIDNLLNQDYQEVLGYPAYRLNFSTGMRLRFGGGK